MDLGSPLRTLAADGAGSLTASRDVVIYRGFEGSGSRSDSLFGEGRSVRRLSAKKTRHLIGPRSLRLSPITQYWHSNAAERIDSACEECLATL